MSTVWVLGPGEDDVRDDGGFEDGDYVLRTDGEQVMVGAVTEAGVEWLDTLDPATLAPGPRSELEQAEPGVNRADSQEELLRAARGVQDAHSHRGG